MSRHTALRWGLVAATLATLLSLPACENRDPYERHDVWTPTGSNMANIAAQVANPYDLIRGRGETTTDTKASELAVEHIITDQPKTISTGGSGGSSGSSGSSGGGGGSGGSSGGGSGGSSGSSSSGS
jgi:uncharacterized membrane protein YgcG